MKKTISFRSLVVCVAAIGACLALALVGLLLLNQPGFYVIAMLFMLCVSAYWAALCRCPYCGRGQNGYHLLGARRNRHFCSGCGEEIDVE